MPRQPRKPPSERQLAALAAGRAKAEQMYRDGLIVRGGHRRGARRTDLPPEPEGPRAVVVGDQAPEHAPAPAPEPPKSRRITWPTPPTPKSAEPASAEPAAGGSPAAEPEPVSTSESSPLPTPAPAPRVGSLAGFFAGLTEGFRS